jgi:hypothetical protein
LNGLIFRRPANSGGNYPILVENKCGWGLQDVELVGQVKPVSDVDLDVQNIIVLIFKLVKQPCRLNALAAHFGRKLKEGDAVAEFLSGR